MGVPTLPDASCDKGGWCPTVNSWTPLIQKMADRYGLPWHWVAGIMKIESSGYQNAGSPAGAQGLMQLMPATARITAKSIGMLGYSDSLIRDPETNLELGVAYLRQKVDYYKDFVAASVAYNAGKVYCGPSCKQAEFWGVCTDGSPYPLIAIKASNTAIDKGFPLGGPLPDMNNLPPVALPSRPFIRELPTFGAILVTALGAYAGYWATQQTLRPRSRARRGYRTLKRAFA